MDAVVWRQLLATPVSELPLTYVDVETTGLNVAYGDRVCEIAVVHCVGGREVERYGSLVNPERSISPGAAAVNGLTDAMVQDAPLFPQIATDVLRLLCQGIPVGHNAPFDLAFLGNEVRRAGLPLPGSFALDTLALARRCFTFRSNSLPSIARELGLHGGGHRAMADALVTRNVLDRFVSMLEDRHQPLDLAGLFTLQGGGVPWPVARRVDTPPLPPQLGEAVDAGRSLLLRYVSADGTLTERSVDPIKVVTQQEDIYLVAFCHLRQDRRTFRIDRIVRWETI